MRIRYTAGTLPHGSQYAVWDGDNGRWASQTYASLAEAVEAAERMSVEYWEAVSGGQKIDGVQLRQRRTALGLSQEHLGRELGVSGNTIARWERGDLNVSAPPMLWLALESLERRHAP